MWCICSDWSCKSSLVCTALATGTSCRACCRSAQFRLYFDATENQINHKWDQTSHKMSKIHITAWESIAIFTCICTVRLLLNKILTKLITLFTHKTHIHYPEDALLMLHLHEQSTVVVLNTQTSAVTLSYTVRSKTRSSATAEKQCISCACRLTNWSCNAQNTTESKRLYYFWHSNALIRELLAKNGFCHEIGIQDHSFCNQLPVDKG